MASAPGISRGRVRRRLWTRPGARTSRRFVGLPPCPFRFAAVAFLYAPVATAARRVVLALVSFRRMSWSLAAAAFPALS